MKKIKILSLVLLITISILCIVGCSSKTNHKNASKDNSTPTTSGNPTDNLATPPSNSSTPTDGFQLTVGTVEAAPGETVQIPVEISNNPGVCAFYIDMTYSEKLSIIKVIDGNVLSSPLHSNKLYKNPYKLSWDDSLAANTNNGVLTTIEFKVSDSAVSGETLTVSIAPMKDGIIDFDLNPLAINCISGGVKVK